MCSYWNKTGGKAYLLNPSTITTLLRLSCGLLGQDLGIETKEISARSLRASGAMALLCAQVDTDIVQLVGRWRSDAMVRYLHVQAAPIMGRFARAMIRGGDYSLAPA